MISEIFLIAFFATILYILYWFFLPFIQASGPHPLSLEPTYIDPSPHHRDARGRAARYPFDTIFTPSVLHLSVVIPAYNEAKRLPAMLSSTIAYLRGRYEKDRTFTSEIIVVDDGSNDETPSIVLAHSQSYTSEFVKLLKAPTNLGKGGAVRLGALHSRGKFVLFVDASNAYSFSALENLQDRLDDELYRGNTLAVAIGSRPELVKKQQINPQTVTELIQQKLRVFMSNVSGLQHVTDTQCGFKLFTRDACRWLFTNQKLSNWCFDVELLFITNEKKIKLYEVPVTHQAPLGGSKANTIPALLSMARDVLLIRALYYLGIWKIETPEFYKQFIVTYEPTSAGKLD